MLGQAASPLQTAYYAAAQLLSSTTCERPADTLLVSMLFEGVYASDFEELYANASAGAVATLVPGAAASTNASAAPQWAITPVRVSAPPKRHRHRLLRQMPIVADLSGSPAALTLALFAVPTSDRTAAAAALQSEGASEDAAYRFYSALRLAGVPFKPRAVTVDGKLLSGVLSGTPLAAWAVSGRPDAPPTPLARNEPGPAASGSRGSSSKLSRVALIGLIAGSVGGVVAVLLVTCTGCIVRRRKRGQPSEAGTPRSPCSDSSVRIPMDFEEEDWQNSREGRVRFQDDKLFDYGETLRQK